MTGHYNYVILFIYYHLHMNVARVQHCNQGNFLDSKF